MLPVGGHDQARSNATTALLTSAPPLLTSALVLTVGAIRARPVVTPLARSMWAWVEVRLVMVTGTMVRVLRLQGVWSLVEVLGADRSVLHEVGVVLRVLQVLRVLRTSRTVLRVLRGLWTALRPWRV